MQRETAPSIQTPAVPRSLSARAADRLTALVVALLVAGTGLVYAQWLHPMQWDADEGIMLMTARMMGQGYSLYTDIWSDHPPGVPLSLLTAFRLFGESVEVGRLTTVFYGLVGLVGVAWLAHQLAQTAGLGRLAGPAAVLALALTPNFFWLARSVQRDIPPLSVGLLSLALAYRYTATRSRRWLFAAGLVMGWALWLKLIGVVLLLPLVLVAWLGIGWGGQGWREGGWATLALALGGLLVWLPFPLVYNVGAFIQQVVGTPVAARNVWPNRAAEYAQWIVEYLTVENLALTALAGLGLAALLRRRWQVGAILLVWLGVTVVSLVNQRPLFAKHHFALLFYPLAVLAGIGVATAWTTLRQPKQAERWMVAASLAALALVVFHAPSQAALLAESVEPAPYRSLGEAAAWLADHTAPTDFVVGDPPMIAFRAGRNQVPWLVYPSSKRVEAGLLTDDEAIRVTQEYQPAAIALWNGRLDRLEGYVAWLQQTYATAVRNDDRVILAPLDRVIQQRQPARLGEVADFLGYDLAVQGREVTLTLYWRSLAPMPVDYTVFNHLVGPDGKGYGQHDGPPDGGRAMTSTWTPGQIIADTHRLTIAPNAPTDLRLQVGLYDPKTGARLPVVENDRAVDGAQLTLNTPIQPPP